MAAPKVMCGRKRYALRAGALRHVGHALIERRQLVRTARASRGTGRVIEVRTGVRPSPPTDTLAPSCATSVVLPGAATASVAAVNIEPVHAAARRGP